MTRDMTVELKALRLHGMAGRFGIVTDCFGNVTDGSFVTA